MSARKLTVAATAKAAPKKNAVPRKKTQEPALPPSEPASPALPAPYTSNRLLTVRQASGMLQISERKMWGMVARKVVRSIKTDGRSRRIPLSALEAYIESQLDLSA